MDPTSSTSAPGSPRRRTRSIRRPAGEPDDEKHYYSSKPALLPTLIAGMLYPRELSRRPARSGRAPGARGALDADAGRNRTGQGQGRAREADEPAKWPAYVFYFDPALIVLNILPYLRFLVLFGRVLDRYAANDWAWFFSLVAGGVRHLPASVHPDAEQPHASPPSSPSSRSTSSCGSGTSGELSAWRFAGARLLRRLRGDERAAGDRRSCAWLAGLLLFRFPKKTLPVLVPAAAAPDRGPARDAVRGVRRVSRWPTRSSARRRTCGREASGRRRWSWTL